MNNQDAEIKKSGGPFYDLLLFHGFVKKRWQATVILWVMLLFLVLGTHFIWRQHQMDKQHKKQTNTLQMVVACEIYTDVLPPSICSQYE